MMKDEVYFWIKEMFISQFPDYTLGKRGKIVILLDGHTSHTDVKPACSAMNMGEYCAIS